MAISHKFDPLVALANQNQVVINSQTLDGWFESQLDRYYYDQGQIIEIDGIKSGGITIDESTQTITIVGQASYFDIPNLTTTMTLWLDEQNQAQFKVNYQLIKDRNQTTKWHFSDSFNNLPLKTSNSLLSNNLLSIGQYKITPFLDDLDFATAAFVVTSCDSIDENLVTGINFKGKVMPLGFLGILQKSVKNRYWRDFFL